MRTTYLELENQGPGRHIGANQDLIDLIGPIEQAPIDEETFRVRPYVNTRLRVGSMVLGEFCPDITELSNVGGRTAPILHAITYAPENSYAPEKEYDVRRMDDMRMMKGLLKGLRHGAQSGVTVSSHEDQGESLSQQLIAMGGLKRHDAATTRGLGAKIRKNHPIDQSDDALQRRKAAFVENRRRQGFIFPEANDAHSQDNHYEPDKPTGGFMARGTMIIQKIQNLRHGARQPSETTPSHKGRLDSVREKVMAIVSLRRRNASARGGL